MFVYEVRWVERMAGPQEYDPHEQEHRSTDLHGKDLVTCSNARMAFDYVKMARPNAVVERPKLLGPA